MFRRYGRGHSAGLGFLLALALEQHALVFALLVFLAGLVTGRAWAFWSDTARAIKMRLLNAHAKREHIETRPQPVYSSRKARGAPADDGIPY